jgi:hypothetical protein
MLRVMRVEVSGITDKGIEPGATEPAGRIIVAKA